MFIYIFIYVERERERDRERDRERERDTHTHTYIYISIYLYLYLHIYIYKHSRIVSLSIYMHTSVLGVVVGGATAVRAAAGGVYYIHIYIEVNSSIDYIVYTCTPLCCSGC